MTTPPDDSPDLRERYAAAILRAGGGESVGPHTAADAVMAVRDDELERMRAELAEAREEHQNEIASLQRLADRFRQQDDERHTRLLAELERIRRALAGFSEDYTAGEDTASGVELLVRHQKEYEADVQRILRAKTEALGRAEAERDALKAAIEEARTRLRIHLAEVEGCERAGGNPGLVWAIDLRKTLAALDTPETPGDAEEAT